MRRFGNRFGLLVSLLEGLSTSHYGFDNKNFFVRYLIENRGILSRFEIGTVFE